MRSILERLLRQTPAGAAFRRYQHNFPFPVETNRAVPKGTILFVAPDDQALTIITGILPQVRPNPTQRSNPMMFTINGVEYRLGFHHSHLKRQPPSRFGVPSGITTCMIYRMGRDGEGKPKWHLRHIGSVLQYDGYRYDKGRKDALKAALEDAGWDKPIRSAVWAAYHQRKFAVRGVPCVSTVRAAA
ncbi:MAG: hypothetical protein ACE141_18805 [Bryobacteraceae bacterium]